MELWEIFAANNAQYCSTVVLKLLNVGCVEFDEAHDAAEKVESLVNRLLY